MTNNSGAAHVIELRDVHKSYGAFEALKGISLSVGYGEVAVIIGPSGCGKSTALRCVNLLELPNAGDVMVQRQQMHFGPGVRPPSASTLAKFRTNIGMVFQQFYLFPHMTVLQNVMAGPIYVKKQNPAEAAEKGIALLRKVGLADKEKAMPRELSGGQAQRVGIARALAMEPAVMLFDEVTSALDPELVQEVLQVLRDLAHEGTTMIVVTHEMEFARDVATRVYLMDSGRIIEQGSADEVMNNPTSERAIAFFRRFSQK